MAATRRCVLAGGIALAANPAFAQPVKSRLILLGTGGGPTPKPNRAAPAQVILVGNAAYVIDCGNGVARQLVLAGVPLNALRAVFLTHHHSDHNADYGNLLLLAWATSLTSKVDTYGPPPLVEMTRLFLEMNRMDIATRIADEGRPPLAPLIAPHEITSGGVVMQNANVTVTSCLVDHGAMKPAFAYRFDCPDRSIVISGDTRPSPALVELAKGADVLVHEVMYLPALERLIAGETNAATLREHLLSAHTPAAELGRITTEAGVKTLVHRIGAQYRPTDLRNPDSRYWQTYLKKPENRCLVPATSFAEPDNNQGPKSIWTWFAQDETRPLFFFAGIWREWEGDRGTKSAPDVGKHLVFSFLTTDASQDEAPGHSDATPVCLFTEEARETWMNAPWEIARDLQRPPAPAALKIIATGRKEDGE